MGPRPIRGKADTKGVRPTYEEEVEALPATYADIQAWDATELRTALGRLAGGPAAFAASGGMFAVAALAAQLHERCALEPASPLTPLALMSRPAIAASGAMLFTSSAKHPDAVELLRRLGRPGMRPAVVLTHRDTALLPSREAKVISLPALRLREGFLAVNSVLSMATATTRGYMGDHLPETLAQAEAERWPDEVDRVLVLFPPSLAAVAADLETRASELGLAAVQAADYRNFAHGRHTGLERTLDHTTIVAISDRDSEDLADATLGVLPARATIARWRSASPWPASVLELLVVSMRACGELGARQRVSLARPNVPVFGRRLYRLPIRRRIPNVLLGPIDRKLGAAGAGVAGDQLRAAYAEALDSWGDDVSRARFGGLILDYDGTVCTTEGRFLPPEAKVAAAMNRLLSDGLLLGFASGRGPSIHADLRKVIDRAHWARVHVGLYNGGHIVSLDEDLEDLKSPSPLIATVHKRLRDLPMAAALDWQPRRVQLTVEPSKGAWVKSVMLAEVVGEVLAREPSLPVKVVRSGHSLDVVPQTTTKVSVIERLSALTEQAMLTVGDQGQIGGNDFELLAHGRWSLSVDRCSADLSRCWYLGDGSVSGPALLLRYLKALVERRDGHAFKVGSLP